MTKHDAVVNDLVDEFQRYIQRPEEPNFTIIDIINPAVTERAPRNEGIWQQLLVYFLTPTQEHGFGDEVLSVFIETVEDHTTISDVSDNNSSLTVETEQPTSSGGRVDVLITQKKDWFLCIELKVESEEHGSQTKRYAEADAIGGRDISDFKNQHYLYISPQQSNSVSAGSFEQISWMALEREWRRLLSEKMTVDGAYSTRGSAQLSEFLKLIRSQTTPDHEYYTDVEQACSTYEELASTLASELTSNIRERLENNGNKFEFKKASYDTRRWASREFPAFEHIDPDYDYNYIDIYKHPVWKVGRSKETIVFELQFLLRPHLGPPEYQSHPTIGIHLDIRGGDDLMDKLRNSVKQRGIWDNLKDDGFRPPHIDAHWHFLSKFVRLDQTNTPVTDILAGVDSLTEYIHDLDEIAQQKTTD